MKIRMNILLLALGVALLTCTGRAQTMIGGSESVSLDTTTGDVTVESGWYRDGVMRLWLSTRWDESSQGVLTVNGNEYAALSSDEEKECTVSLPAHSSGTYVCEWAVDGQVYRRTLVSHGARRVSVGGVLALDTRTGVRRISLADEKIRYDVQWAEGASMAVLSCNGEELVRGVSGDYDWMPGAMCNNVLSLSLRDVDGREVAHERAIFISDSSFARIDEEFPWSPGLFDGCENIRKARIECDLKGNVRTDILHRWSFNGDLMDSVGGQTAVAYGSVVCGKDRCTLAGGSHAASYIDLGDNILPVSDAGTTIEIWGDATFFSIVFARD